MGPKIGLYISPYLKGWNSSTYSITDFCAHQAWKSYDEEEAGKPSKYQMNIF